MNTIHSIGARLDPGGDVTKGVLRVSDSVCDHGVVRASALMLLADMTSGVSADVDDPDAWHFTVDCSLRLTAARVHGNVFTQRQPLRRGRTTWVDELSFTDEAGTDLGLCQIGFSRSPLRPEDPPRPEVDHILPLLRSAHHEPLTAPLPEVAGIEVADAATGRLAMILRDDLRQPAGFLQGAIVSLLGEQAALTMSEAALDRPQVVVDLDMRFLVGAMVGPMQTVGRFVGAPDSLGRQAIAVDLIDTGRDRITTTFLARTADAPG